jgi:hypothetical protein
MARKRLRTLAGAIACRGGRLRGLGRDPSGEHELSVYMIEAAMEELRQIILKYQNLNVDDELSSYDKVIAFSDRFYRDVAEIYDALTRLRHLDHNPTGFDFNDAAILGLLVRIWKILKQIVLFYEVKNGQMIALIERPMLEAIVMANYLLIKDDATIEDYRKCSYKDRVEILVDAGRSPGFYATNAGKRLKQSVITKLAAENLTVDSFAEQKKHKWKVGGKSFRDIFSEVVPPEFYKFLYGIASESIHGSWNESMDYDLLRNDDGSFSTNPFYAVPDIRMITPFLEHANRVYALWLKRIHADSEYTDNVFKWITQTNRQMFLAFDKLYFPDAHQLK